MMFDLATRECKTSPQMAISKSLIRPLFCKIMKASSKAWLGCSLVPSPALIIDEEIYCLSKPTIPLALWRMATKSGSIALMVLAVSIKLSPFFKDESEMSMLTTSIPNLLAAISKEVLVLVEFSKKKLRRILFFRLLLIAEPDWFFVKNLAEFFRIELISFSDKSLTEIRFLLFFTIS